MNNHLSIQMHSFQSLLKLIKAFRSIPYVTPILVLPSEMTKKIVLLTQATWIDLPFLNGFNETILVWDNHV